MTGPIYRLKAHDGNAEREIIIDVTRSASTFSTPGEGLKTVLGSILRNPSLGIEDVVDFGAGKLKNVPFILEMGKNVCAVEFERLSFNPVTQSNYDLCGSYDGHFRRLSPDLFAEDVQRFDLALLINVIPTMPIRAERDSALKLIHDKLRDGKYALWFSLKGDDLYKSRMEAGKTCSDGIWLGENRNFQTFYKNYQPEEVIALMHSAGFVPFDRFHVETNHSLLFRKG